MSFGVYDQGLPWFAIPYHLPPFPVCIFSLAVASSLKFEDWLLHSFNDNRNIILFMNMVIILKIYKYHYISTHLSHASLMRTAFWTSHNVLLKPLDAAWSAQCSFHFVDCVIFLRDKRIRETLALQKGKSMEKQQQEELNKCIMYRVFDPHRHQKKRKLQRCGQSFSAKRVLLPVVLLQIDSFVNSCDVFVAIPILNGSHFLSQGCQGGLKPPSCLIGSKQQIFMGGGIVLRHKDYCNLLEKSLDDHTVALEFLLIKQRGWTQLFVHAWWWYQVVVLSDHWNHSAGRELAGLQQPALHLGWLPAVGTANHQCHLGSVEHVVAFLQDGGKWQTGTNQFGVQHWRQHHGRGHCLCVFRVC